MKGHTTTYKDYIIEPLRLLPAPLPWKMRFRHKDYDGPEDFRGGIALDLADAIEQINELEDE